jgi:hypothetical protein
MATCSCIDPPVKWDDVISWFKEELRGKSLKSCPNYVLNLNLQNSLRQKGAKRPTQKSKKAKGGGKREKKNI